MTLSEAEKKVLRTWADCNMHITPTARRCGYCRQTIYDKMMVVEAKTGIDPNDFRGLVKLLTQIGYFED